MPRRPGVNLSMATVKNIYALKGTPQWYALPPGLRDGVAQLFESYIVHNGRILIGGQTTALPKKMTTTAAVGTGANPRGKPRTRNPIPVVNGTLARRTRGAVRPTA